MNLNEVLRQLKALGTEQNRKIYRRHGASANLFGVSFANLGKLKQLIKKDHALALQLWDTGNDDARNLATMIADPARFSSADLDRWAHGQEGGLVCCQLANMTALTPHARTCGMDWIDADHEWAESAGWMVLAKLLMVDSTLTDAWCRKLLKRIERDLHQSKNKVRDVMNSTVIAIGIRNEALLQPALDAAARIGKVEVDHGETSCQTDDAAAYIKHTLLHRQKKAASKAARKK